MASQAQACATPRDYFGDGRLTSTAVIISTIPATISSAVAVVRIATAAAPGHEQDRMLTTPCNDAQLFLGFYCNVFDLS